MAISVFVDVTYAGTRRRVVVGVEADEEAVRDCGDAEGGNADVVVVIIYDIHLLNMHSDKRVVHESARVCAYGVVFCCCCYLRHAFSRRAFAHRRTCACACVCVRTCGVLFLLCRCRVHCVALFLRCG